MSPQGVKVPESAKLLRVMLRLQLHRRAVARRRLMHFGTGRHRRARGSQPAVRTVRSRDRQIPRLAASILQMSSGRSREHLCPDGRQ